VSVFLLCALLGAEIVGPKTVEPYTLAELQLQGTSESAQAAWEILPDGCDYRQMGKGLLLTGKPGNYQASVILVDFDGRTFERLKLSFSIGESPDPAPTPPGPAPSPLTGLAKIVYDLAAATGDKDTAGKIAENYASSISIINAGAYAGELSAAKRKIVSDLYARNSPLTEGKQAWKELFNKLNEIFAAADKAGELSSLAEIAKRFGEIETGLRRAAQ
jgi:hypothetical protein